MTLSGRNTSQNISSYGSMMKVVPKVKREVVIDFDFLSYRLCISKANASLQTHVLQPHTKLEPVSFP